VRGKRRDVDRARLTKPAPLAEDPFLAARGLEIAGPPWILGLRGSPLEAPENTLASLRRALEVGLDGVAYDVRACATGEAVLLRDEGLERTTDGRGRLAERTLPELARFDAGSWFRARFRGEPLALLEDALGLEPAAAGAPVRHVALLRERELLPEVASALRRKPLAPGAAHLASPLREVCLEARDAGLPAMLVIPHASEEARRFVRDERISACAVESGGFGAGEWRCERWSIGADAPQELLEACRTPLAGIATREPLRALALRALAWLAPSYRREHPLSVPELEMQPGELAPGRGEWRGSWDVSAVVRNPFPFEIEATAGVVPRHGAFETEGLPRKLRLSEGSEETVRFRITGGSWRVGGDPLFFALYRFKRGKGRRSGSLLLDAPLVRVRSAVADLLAQRLPQETSSSRSRTPAASRALARSSTSTAASSAEGAACARRCPTTSTGGRAASPSAAVSRAPRAGSASCAAGRAGSPTRTASARRGGCSRRPALETQRSGRNAGGVPR
jgi:hypothetical protein